MPRPGSLCTGRWRGRAVERSHPAAFVWAMVDWNTHFGRRSGDRHALEDIRWVRCRLDLLDRRLKRIKSQALTAWVRAWADQGSTSTRSTLIQT
jgi:hypothetical protein